MRTARKPWLDALARHGACAEGLAFVAKYAHAQEAWDAIEKPSWLCWWATREPNNEWSDARKPLAAALCEAAMCLCSPVDDEIEIGRQWALDAALRWTRGDADADEVMAAYSTVTMSAAAAYAASAYAASAPVSASAYAIIAISWDENAKHQRTICDIIREHIPHPPVLS